MNLWRKFLLLIIAFACAIPATQAGFKQDAYGLRFGSTFGAPMGPILVGQRVAPDYNRQLPFTTRNASIPNGD